MMGTTVYSSGGACLRHTKKSYAHPPYAKRVCRVPSYVIIYCDMQLLVIYCIAMASPNVKIITNPMCEFLSILAASRLARIVGVSANLEKRIYEHYSTYLIDRSLNDLNDSCY